MTWVRFLTLENRVVVTLCVPSSYGRYVPANYPDGYAPGAGGDISCASHSSDYQEQNWVISLSELLRLIQFYNSLAYHVCAEGEDGFCPGA